MINKFKTWWTTGSVQVVILKNVIAVICLLFLAALFFRISAVLGVLLLAFAFVLLVPLILKVIAFSLNTEKHDNSKHK